MELKDQYLVRVIRRAITGHRWQRPTVGTNEGLTLECARPKKGAPFSAFPHLDGQLFTDDVCGPAPIRQLQ